MNVYGVVLFYTTSSAIHAEKVLVKAGLIVKLVPTPRQFSSDCGVALRFDWGQLEDVRSLLQAADIDVDSVHPL